MPLKRQLLYYQLLKYSGQGTLCGDVLDQAVDRLCSVPSATLASVSLKLQHEGLMLKAKELGVLSVPEVAQLCIEIKFALERNRGSGVATVLLSRALEAAGVAFAISAFTEKYRSFLESRLYSTQGLKHLLNHHGDQVLKEISASILTFEAVYTTCALQLHAASQALISLRRTNPEVYGILSKHQRTGGFFGAKGMKRYKTASLSLDDQEQAEDIPGVAKILLGRRAFSVDVQAGVELLLAASPQC